MRLTQQQLEAHLWGAANILRGKTAGQDYKNYILSLMFYKRLCDQWENETDEVIAEQERQQRRTFTDQQKAYFKAHSQHRFSIPEGSRWGDVLAASTNLGEVLTDAMKAVADASLSRNTLKHIKSVVSAIFTLAKQQDYFHAENPARDTAINPGAAEPQETYAYSLEEIYTILSRLPEPAGTAFAIAAFMGLRHGEIRGLQWENYQNEEMQVSRSIWNGRVTDPKTRKGRAPVPVIRQLAERLELHRLRCRSPQTGPIFANALGKPLALSSITNRLILPSLNVCERCGKGESDHQKANHEYKRDSRIPEWHGWHAARRGLGSNLYRLGVPDMVIQRILRHANVSTTATYYIKTAAADVRSAMTKLENHIAEAGKPQRDTIGTSEGLLGPGHSTIQ